MAFRPREKTPNPGPVLKRDANNRLDKGDALDQTQKLMQKLATEQRAWEKDISHMAATSKRDIYVFVTVGVRNSVDGKIAIGEIADVNGWWRSETQGDPYLYKNFDYAEYYIPATQQPVSQSELGKGLGGLFKATTNFIARMKGMKL